MLRMPRKISGPWAALAGGSLALLAIVSLASSPLALPDWPWTPKQQEPEPLNWVADRGHYPPALLRVQDRVTPAELEFEPAVLAELNHAPSVAGARPAAYNDDWGLPDEQPRSVLRRLPEVESPPAVAPRLPPEDWRDERLPELADLDPPSVAAPGLAPRARDDWNPRPSTDGHPGAGGNFEGHFTPSNAPREETPTLPLVAAIPPASALPAPTFERNPAPTRGAPLPPPSQATTAAMQSVADRANELTRHGLALADRGAFYSAKAEFIQALRLLTQAFDGTASEQRHSRALAAGLKAIAEADDFVPRGARLEADLDVAAIVTAHNTPVLKNFAGRAMPLAAVQRYYTFAQEQLIVAGGREPAASAALYGLGRIYLALAKESADARRLSGPKAMTFHQAALMIDPRNYRAANELGVLLAKYGQLDEAKRMLLAALSTSRSKEAWHNLAVVHERLGEADLALRARHEVQILSAGAVPTSDALVRWVSPREFSEMARYPQMGAAAPSGAPSAAPVQTAQKKATGISWPWK
jgi:hypothetical protein